MMLSSVTAIMRCKCGAMFGNELAQVGDNEHVCVCKTCSRRWSIMNYTKCDDGVWRFETCLEKTAS